MPDRRRRHRFSLNGDVEHLDPSPIPELDLVPTTEGADQQAPPLVQRSAHEQDAVLASPDPRDANERLAGPCGRGRPWGKHLASGRDHDRHRTVTRGRALDLCFNRPGPPYPEVVAWRLPSLLQHLYQAAHTRGRALDRAGFGKRTGRETRLVHHPVRSSARIR
jgi:hypothetical protein